MLVERISAGHLRYRVDRKTGVGEVGRLQRRVSHSQECSSTSGARVSRRKRFWKNWSPFRCSPFWLPTTDGRCSTLPAQGRRAPRKTRGLYAGSGRVPTECCQSGGHCDARRGLSQQSRKTGTQINAQRRRSGRGANDGAAPQPPRAPASPCTHFGNKCIM